MVEIHTSRVPEDKRNHSEYRCRYSELQALLDSSSSIDLYCVHEAGHLIFGKRAGLTEFKFHGPTMTYDGVTPDKDEKERFGYFLAAVETPETSRIQKYDDALLDAMAKCAVAGEVFEEVRRGVPLKPIEKSWDFDTFDHFCRNARRADRDIDYDAKGRWLRAQPHVRIYLRDQANEAEIQSAIATVKYGCFRLR
jgi:hypothetical protein